MPKLITIKRADTVNLNTHVLADGEPAFTRNVDLYGGPQHGEKIKDHSLRVGDGQTAGGITPDSKVFSAALAFAMSSVSTAMVELESLKARVDALEGA